MKKKGFTLIELLAVIVVLAIIALIATPIVMNTIKSAKKGAAEITTQNYIRAVEIAVATSALNRKSIPSGSYSIDSDGNLIGTELPDGKLEIDVSGDKPTGGTIVIKDGQVTTDSKVMVGEYGVSYDETTKKYIAVRVYSNGEVVYFNVTTGEKCSNYTETQSNVGINSGCMKFYAFNDNGGNTVNLLLDHNTTALVAWNSSGSNTSGPKEVLDSLKASTASWQGTETPTNYTMDQTGQTSNANYTIDYSGYKARLITAQEVAMITGNTAWDEKVSANSNYYYFDTKKSQASDTCKSGNISGCAYGWLYDRTKPNCTTYGCLNNSDKSTLGYWASSSRAANTTDAWGVRYNANVLTFNADNVSNFGVRPVITVLKSKLG